MTSVNFIFLKWITITPADRQFFPSTNPLSATYWLGRYTSFFLSLKKTGFKILPFSLSKLLHAILYILFQLNHLMYLYSILYIYSLSFLYEYTLSPDYLIYNSLEGCPIIHFLYFFHLHPYLFAFYCHFYIIFISIPPIF